jgi:hypothetical protein
VSKLTGGRVVVALAAVVVLIVVMVLAAVGVVGAVLDFKLVVVLTESLLVIVLFRSYKWRRE